MKYVVTVVIFLAAVASVFLLFPKKGNTKISEVVVKQVEPQDDELLEVWIRQTEDNDILGISAVRSVGDWPWAVDINVAEFVRTDPLESELQASIRNALLSVPGVTRVAHEDREVWVVQGNPEGADLVRACAAVVDTLSDSTRKMINEL
jgi:hypothetical protein